MSTHKGRIFMTGANGYVGSVITEFAIAEGYQVHGLSRGDEGLAKLKGLGATPVKGDLHSLDVLQHESAQADIVIHLADAFGGSHFSMDYEEVKRIDKAAVDAMAAGLKGSNKPLLVTGGTLLVEPDPNGAETTETSPLPENPLLDRIKLEEHALSKCSDGIRVIAIRLAPYVYGRGGSGVKLFMQMAAGAGQVVYLNQGTERITAVHVDDAARMYLLAAEKAKAGEVFNCTSSTTVTNRQLAEAMGKALNLPLASRTYDEQLAKTGPFFAKFLSTENRASSAKAQRELGWQPREKMGILEEISDGSYVELSKELRKA